MLSLIAIQVLHKVIDQPASASDFDWYHFKENNNSIKAPPTKPSPTKPPPIKPPPANQPHAQCTGCGEKMAKALTFEKADELGNLIKHLNAKVAPGQAE